MGLPMARRLRAAGFPVRGLDIRPASEFGDFAPLMLEDAAELADSQVLISVVRDQQQTLDLCFDQQRVYRRANYPKLLVVCSTLSPGFVHLLASRLPADVTVIDAPMSGAPVAAVNGRLSFMLGGDEAEIAILMPLFAAMGDQIFHAGDLGAGMTIKVLNNYVAASSVVAVRRAYEMADALNVDLDRLRTVMRASSGATWYGDRFDDIDWARQGYDSSNTIGILEKDVLSALDAIVDVEDLAESALDAAILDALRRLKPF